MHVPAVPILLHFGMPILTLNLRIYRNMDTSIHANQFMLSRVQQFTSLLIDVALHSTLYVCALLRLETKTYVRNWHWSCVVQRNCLGPAEKLCRGSTAVNLFPKTTDVPSKTKTLFDGTQ